MTRDLPETLPAAHPLDTQSQQVTRESKWTDAVWVFSNNGGGREDVNIYWDFAIIDDERSISPEWNHLVELGRHVIWSMWSCKTDGPRVRPGTLRRRFTVLTFLLRWMASADYRSFAEFTSTTGNEYLAHVKTCYPPSTTTFQEAMLRTEVLERVYGLRDAMARANGGVMACRPYGDVNLRNILRKQYQTNNQSYSPFEDEIYTEIMNAALTWMGAPARDVIRLMNIYQNYVEDEFTAKISGSQGTISMGWVAEAPLLDFIFDDEGELEAPWRSPLQRELRFHDWTYHTRKTQGKILKSRWNVFKQLERLIETVTAACTIIVQGSTGIRVSELCDLEAEPLYRDQGLPSCIRIKESSDGLTELFLFRGRSIKSKSTEEVEWLAGSRPTGTDYIPPSVEAIAILEKLYRWWRDLYEIDDLVISLIWHKKDRSFGPEPSTERHVRYIQKSFVAREVEYESDGDYWDIGTHQWRKTFALFSVRTDENIIPALASHFKHMSIANLEQYYVGNDPEMLGMRRDIASRELARMLSSVLDGNYRFAGRMAKTMAGQADRIEKMLPPRSQPKERETALMKLAEGSGVGVWPSDWGKCVFRPEKARCHEAATGFFNTSAESPHYGARRPGLCSGCSNLMVGPEHQNYWRDRHRENLSIYEKNLAGGDPVSARIAGERVKVSENILRKLGLMEEPEVVEDSDVEPF